MKKYKHFALVDSNGVIHDTLEGNEKEAICTPIPGLTWIEIKNPHKDFHKDPEKFNIDKGSSKVKDSIKLTASTTKAFVNDTVSVTVEFFGIKAKDLPVLINVDGQNVSVNDKDVLDLVLQHEGVYKIYCADPRFYCNVVIIDAILP